MTRESAGIEKVKYQNIAQRILNRTERFVILFVSQIFMTAPNIKQLKMGKACIFFLIQSHLSSIPEMEAVF